VHLAKHAVKVRVVDLVARTEVDETFTNDTDEELEGIFRFPLPPGAQIEKLALEVDGKLDRGRLRGSRQGRGDLARRDPERGAEAVKQREEIIWVPGPWRDPALLEWQRGGRFELRIFPIPKRGSRRVCSRTRRLVEQSGGVRRFTYPLAHDTSGTTRVDSLRRGRAGARHTTRASASRRAATSSRSRLRRGRGRIGGRSTPTTSRRRAI
jgi:hypothetical protein